MKNTVGRNHPEIIGLIGMVIFGSPRTVDVNRRLDIMTILGAVGEIGRGFKHMPGALVVF